MEQASAEQRDVVTGHTATDRAETLLLQMARGTDLAGLGSLRPLRPLSAAAPEGPWLRRPLLSFSRHDTGAICRDLTLPLWLDPSNADPAYARNRVRLELLPVLEALHPGAERRMADLAERLSQVQDTRQELAELALQHLAVRHRRPRVHLPDPLEPLHRLLGDGGGEAGDRAGERGGRSG